jgi:hypothetical protein
LLVQLHRELEVGYCTAWQQGSKELLHPHGKTCTQTLPEDDQQHNGSLFAAFISAHHP